MTITVKRSDVPGKVPTVDDLELGELALNTRDGKAYLKRNNGVNPPEVIPLGGEVAADTYAAVSGTAPVLDMSIGNIFDQGALTGDTTITFANVPEVARVIYSFVGAEGDGYNMTAMTQTSTLDDADVDKSQSIAFSPDGTKFFVAEDGGGIRQYNLSTAWDVSTAAHATPSTEADGIGAGGLFFKPDGTRVFMTDGMAVQQLDLATPWDLSSEVSGSLTSSGNLVNQYELHGLWFSDDGLRLWVGQRHYPSQIVEFALSTAWDVTTAGTAIRSETLDGSHGRQPNPVGFDDTGLRFFVHLREENTLREYALTTPFDVSAIDNATDYASISLAPMASSATVNAVCFADGGKKLALTSVGHGVDMGSIVSSYGVTFPAAMQDAPNLSVEVGTRYVYEFITVDGGAHFYTRAETGFY